jgi:hypothetical protein
MNKFKFESRIFSFYKNTKKNFGIASFFSKYVIIGSGFAGLTLTNLLLSVSKINFII